MKLKLLILSTLAILLIAPSSFGKTFYVSESVGNDTFDGSSPVVVTDTIGPFRTIVHALDSAMDGDTILVADGVYREHLVVTRQVVILGANYTLSGRGARGAETILQPESDSLGIIPDDRNTLVTILSDNVIFRGFTITGDNDTLLSGNIIGSADVDVSYGIYIIGARSGVEVTNNVITAFQYAGVDASAGGAPGSSGNVLSENWIKNIGATGVCVQLRDDAHLNVTYNNLDSAVLGILCRLMTDNLAANVALSDNNIKTDGGLAVFSYTSVNASVLIANNTITPPAVTGAFGIRLEELAAGTDIQTQGNDISGMIQGMSVINPNGATIVMTGDSIQSANRWISWSSADAMSDTLRINALAATGASGFGIDIVNDLSRTVVEMQNVIARTAANGISIAGDVQLIPGNTQLASITGYYLRLMANGSGAVPTVDIDALSVVFDGNTGAAMTDVQGMVAEDKILHYMDNSQLAFADFKTAHLFISLVDGNDSLNRALNRVADNYIIVSRGHYFDETAVISNDLFWRPLAQDSIQLLEMNGTGKTLHLEGRVNVKDGLTLTDGIINTTAGTMYVGYHTQAEAINGISGGSSTSYVEGPMFVVNTAQLNGDEIFFPISTDTNYRPVRMHITHLSAGVSYTVRGQVINNPTTGAILSPDITHTSIVRYWAFSVLGFNPISNIEYEAVYGTTNVTDDVEFPNELRLAVNTGTGWRNIGGTGSAPFDGTIRSDSAYRFIANLALANFTDGDNRLGIDGTLSRFTWLNNCLTDSFRFFSDANTTGDSIVRYFWDFGDTAVTTDTSNLMDPVFRFNSAGTYMVTHVAEDNNGSIDTVVLEVVVDPIPIVGFNTFIPCFPANISFTDASAIASGSIVDWDWTLDTFSGGGPNLSLGFPDTGTYVIKLIATSDKGCVDSTTRSIYYGDSVRITISPLGPINKCIDSVITITATTNALFYRWIETDDTAYSTDVVDPGVYTFRGSTGANCIAQDTVEVIDLPSPIVDAGMDTTIWRGTGAVLKGTASSSMPIADWTWTPNDGSLDDNKVANPLARPNKNTTYHLLVTNSIGCTGYDSVFVEVNWPETFAVQNLVTPNNDQMNDVWDLSNVPAIENAKVYVLSRWGKQVYYSEDYLNDGRFDGNNEDGEPLPEGTYTYLIIFDLEDLGSVRGNLQILR